MELMSKHLNRICCEVTLFNRQRWKIKNSFAELIIVDGAGKQKMIHKQALYDPEKRKLFFSQIKFLWFDGKIVTYRGCGEQPLRLTNKHFSKLVYRQKLLIDAEKAYQNLMKRELN